MIHAWVIGVLIVSLSALFTNLGINVQKLAHASMAKTNSAKAFFCLHPIWALGFALMVFGAIGDFIALGITAQSIVAPLGALTLVFNIPIAGWLHGERITVQGVVGTALIALGSVLTVVSADHHDIKLNIDEIFSLYTTTRFIVYASIMTPSIAAMWTILVRMKVNSQEFFEFSPRKLAVFKILIAILSGILGSHSMLFSKFSAELILGSDSRIMRNGVFYLTLLLMSLFVVGQIYWLNIGLKRIESIYIVPVSKSIWIVFSVVSGMITFAEYTRFSVLKALLFSSGIILIISGVLIFSRSSPVRKSNSFTLDEEPCTEPLIQSSTQIHHPL